MTLTEKIQDTFIGAKYRGAHWMEEELTGLVGLRMCCYDSVIDDGADDDETEDQYVIRDCFSDEKDNIVVHIYYGDVTREIGYVDVKETAI